MMKDRFSTCFLSILAPLPVMVNLSRPCDACEDVVGGCSQGDRIAIS
jgi:hypothetical protein